MEKKIKLKKDTHKTQHKFQKISSMCNEKEKKLTNGVRLRHQKIGKLLPYKLSAMGARVGKPGPGPDVIRCSGRVFQVNPSI